MNQDLLHHLPFCLKMLTRLKDTPHEDKWNKVYELISSDLRLTVEYAAKIDNILKDIRIKLEKISQQTFPSQNAEQETDKTEDNNLRDQNILSNNNLALEDQTKLLTLCHELESNDKDQKDSSEGFSLSTKTQELSSDTNKKVNGRSFRPRKVPPLKIRLTEILKRRVEKRQKREHKRLKRLMKKDLQKKSALEENLKSTELRMEKKSDSPETSGSGVLKINKECSIILQRLDLACWSHQLKVNNESQVIATNPINESSEVNNISNMVPTSVALIPSSEIKIEKIDNPINPPMVSIPIEFVEESSPTMPKKKQKTNQEVEESELTLLDRSATQMKLRPWLPLTNTNRSQKFSGVCEAMLNEGCLRALFKCMGIACRFYTDDAALFQTHLDFHFKHQKSELNNFSSCSYCDFSGIKELVTHITAEHGSNKYQCPYCFYRSYDLQVQTHLDMHHSRRKGIIIKCHVHRPKQISKDLVNVWKAFPKNVPALSCMICKQLFYDFSLFLNHLNSHGNLPASKCVKCNGVITIGTIINHLKTCHGFGNLQCAFCRFGTDKQDVLAGHLSSFHPDQLLLYFDRSCDPRSSKFLTPTKFHMAKPLALKKLPLSLSSRCTIQTCHSSGTRNEMNVHKISSNFVINPLI